VLKAALTDVFYAEQELGRSRRIPTIRRINLDKHL